MLPENQSEKWKCHVVWFLLWFCFDLFFVFGWLILWEKVSAFAVDINISIAVLSPRILRKDVFYSQNVMRFKQLNRKSTLLTKEVLQYLSCQLCSDLSWKVIRQAVFQKLPFLSCVLYEKQQSSDSSAVRGATVSMAGEWKS